MMFRNLVSRVMLAVLPSDAIVFQSYEQPDAVGYDGVIAHKSSGRILAFVEHKGGLVFSW